MVKIGFIVEGDTESIIVNSPAFISFLRANNFELVTPVIDAKGGGNLLPKYVENFVERLRNIGAERFCILTDLEDAASIADVQARIAHQDVDVSFIAVKAVEAWFLADSEAMKKWLKVDEFNEEQPEATAEMPWDRLKEVSRKLRKRGPGSSKTAFAKRMVTHHGFDIQSSARHPSCPSARELVEWFENQ
ncbi:hypothetical protein ACB496_02670 [Lelliottia nimipressuralis]|uniref:hypothetical protein n=1 Tax=Lelliottia nimipressuralis TaxID=69220 RepID=UPI003558C0A7